MKQNKYLRRFYAEHDDSGGVADLLTSPDVEQEVDLNPQPEPTLSELHTNSDAAPEPEKASAAPTIDVATLTAALSAAFPKSSVSTEPAQPKLSQAEIDKLLKKPVIDDAFLERFDNIATKKEALVDLIERTAAYAEARSQVHTYGETSRIEQSLAPRLAAFEAFQAQQREQRFNSLYPDLAKPELRTIIGAVAQQALSTQKFADENSAFDAIAKGVERVIQTHTPTFKLTTGKKPASNLNALPTTSAGSGGGGGGQPTGTPRKGPPGIELFTSLR